MIRCKLWLIFNLIILSCTAYVHAQNPAEVSLWGKEPVEYLSDTRSQMCLNGVWRFMPIVDSVASPASDWGFIRQPGSWMMPPWWANTPGIIKKGQTAIWNVDYEKLNKAYYERDILVPRSWKNSKILLSIERVSTEAIIYINDTKVGELGWNSGIIDLTPFVEPGKAARLKIIVAAYVNEKESPVYMGTATEQFSLTPAKLATAGITGNVFLYKRPMGAYIDDVFVQPSYRKKNVAVTFILKGSKQPGIFTAIASFKDMHGKVERVIRKQFKSTGEVEQVFTIEGDWPSPRIWDLDHPEMYHLDLKLEGQGVHDTYPQEFGFREFWIDGKDFILNGKKINLRPILGVNGDGMDEIIDATLSGLRKSGFNFMELWPESEAQRGYLNYWDRIAERADRKGFLISGVLQSMNRFIGGPNYSYQWDKPGLKEQWKAWMLSQMRKMRNHPSVIIWGTSANFFGNADDQNPINIGRRDWIKENEFWQRNSKAGAEGIEIIKQQDPTRPVFTHHGAYVGDVHTVNLYLNLIPLQEREEWLSHYNSHGEMPFMGIEFGTPLECTFLRGRNGFAKNIRSESLMTEFSAMYLGTRAFKVETPEYRQEIKNQFLGGDLYKSWQFNRPLNFSPAFQEVQYLFNQNTWRSWRTWGISGGMVPWNDGHGWFQNTSEVKKVPMPQFTPGRRGTYYDSISTAKLNYFQPPQWQVLPSGKSLIKNNNTYLAWIAGKEAAFTDKSHTFASGSLVEKQFVFINDDRKDVPLKYSYEVFVGSQKVANGQGDGTLQPAEVKHVPLRFTTPSSLASLKTDGRILLKASIGEQSLTDTFSFRVFQVQKRSRSSLVVFDPVGKTTKMLLELGYQVKPWNGEQVPALIVGREALSKKYQVPSSIEKFVSKGGSCLLFQQDSVWLKRAGFRISQYVSRYVFPIDSLHPVVKGLDEYDFRNWTGQSTLTPAYPAITKNTPKGLHNVPYYGWHWGNRGGVSSIAVEKPHLSGWRPILETEFDLAYSPLMELDYGSGRLMLCQLDLEDHSAEDMAAATVTHQLLDYFSEKQPTKANGRVQLLGDVEDAALLKSIGLTFAQSKKIDSSADLIIVGNDSVNEPSLRSYIASGGRVLFLATKAPQTYFGVSLKKDFLAGSIQDVPQWAETRGLSPSDTRWRTEDSLYVLRQGNDLNITSNGLLGKMGIGKGVAVFCQIDPRELDVATKTYFRFTRWRQTRTLVQILANMGAQFAADQNVFYQEYPENKNKASFYHSDYRSDFEMGDDPYRYYRW